MILEFIRRHRLLVTSVAWIVSTFGAMLIMLSREGGATNLAALPSIGDLPFTIIISSITVPMIALLGEQSSVGISAMDAMVARSALAAWAVTVLILYVAPYGRDEEEPKG